MTFPYKFDFATSLEKVSYSIFNLRNRCLPSIKYICIVLSIRSFKPIKHSCQLSSQRTLNTRTVKMGQVLRQIWFHPGPSFTTKARFFSSLGVPFTQEDLNPERLQLASRMNGELASNWDLLWNSC